MALEYRDGKEPKKITMKDDVLYPIVRSDIEAAEAYFDDYIKERVMTRYDLIHSDKGYYQSRFNTLSKYTDYSTTEIKDAIEWIMPSLVEIIFGADKMVGIFGRTPDDNPEILEKLIKFQVKTQNPGYKIIEQYVRDMLEAALGVTKVEWHKVTEMVEEVIQMNQDEFQAFDAAMMKKAVAEDDGTFTVTVKKEKTIKDQPVIENLMPSRWIYHPDVDENGVSVFEAERSYVLYSDLKKWQKRGLVQNVGKITGETPTDEPSSVLDEVADSIANYTGEKVAKQSEDTESDRTSTPVQKAREKVLLYKCYGKYDVNGDDMLEDCCIWVAGTTIIKKIINPYSRPIFFDGYAFAKSYVRWKEGVADIIQDIQDLKTALTRQVIINTAINNDRKIAVDGRQEDAMSDLANGKKAIRMNLRAGQTVKDVMDHFPEHKLSSETFALLETLQGSVEQRVGITRYNQGLDADSLNKTATGITKIMAASQQRLRMIARNVAETGIVPLYRFLVELNQFHVDQEMVIRLTGEYLTIQPDDIKGDFDVQITSNIGLQDSQLTVQNLMLMLTQILPGLVNMGVATPLGVYETSKQLIESMGFHNADEFIGASEAEIKQQLQQQDAMSQLGQILPQLMKAAGVAPEQAAMVTQGLAQVMQPQEQEGQQPNGSTAQR